MAFENLKTKFDQWSVHQRFNHKREDKLAKQKKEKEALHQALIHPEDTKVYNRALHQIARHQTGENLKAFGKWVLMDLIWLVVPYIPYSVWSLTLTQTLLLKTIDAHTLWGIQERLLLEAIITGVFVFIATQHIIKRGWFHRPYKQGDLNNFIKELQKENQARERKAKQIKHHPHNKRYHK